MSRSRSGDSIAKRDNFIYRTFSKTVSVWLLATVILFGALGTMTFGWYVKRSLFLDDDHWLARAAVAIASFPSYAKEAFAETRQRLFEGPNLRHVRATGEGYEASAFSPVKSESPDAAGSLIVRHGSGALQRGWYVIVGAFKIGGSAEDAALLLSPDLDIVHYWLLGEGGPANADPAPPSWNITHGFAMIEDGSVIYVFRNGISLNRMDPCGRTIWAVPGHYSHSVVLDKDSRTVWAIRLDAMPDTGEGMRLVQIAVDDGRILSDFSIADIIAANPHIDILELRRKHDDDGRRNDPALPGQWSRDPVHLNDIDPLPRDLAGSFPQFAPGDLLVSGRETNLLFVIDPKTLAIKWWRIGATIRQHDPDWMPNGRLSVFNNRQARGYSEIVEIDPASDGRVVTVEGRELGFYSRIRGNHQVLPDGGHLIASTQQGRVMALSRNGDLALEFRAPLDDQHSAFGFLTDAMMLPEDSVDPDLLRCPDRASLRTEPSSVTATAEEASLSP